MAPRNPRTRLATHEVMNQPPPMEDINLFTSDMVLQDAVGREGGAAHGVHLSGFGARAGSAETAEWAMQANRNAPELKTFDRYGQRIDEVAFHPAYHKLMELGLSGGFAARAWTSETGGHVAHAALLYMMAQAEPGVCCPMTMTYAVLPALSHAPALASEWRPRIAGGVYDPASRPAAEKRGVTLGMAMTEKQGGSDVRANATEAKPLGGGVFELKGHKWFCSAPMCDAFLTLAYSPGGLSCLLVPRWRKDGERNAMHIMRLKDKLGDRANASSEIEYHGAEAYLVGEEGRGVRTIIEMVQHTRLDCTVAPASYMRQALANAVWHTSHRTAFQRRLVDQPLMARVLADMAVESEAATVLAFRVARSFDDAARGDRHAALFQRIATPVAKYWLNKRVVNFVYEAMESHGGAGYVEEGVMPRLFRQSPLNSIWEGSGNVICLDVLRALGREPETAMALIGELEQARGAYAALDRAIEAVKARLALRPEEGLARRLVEEMALALQGALLARSAPAFIADAFMATRFGEGGGNAYGAFDASIDVSKVLERARVAA